MIIKPILRSLAYALSISLSISFFTFANADPVTDQIDSQIWKPFTQTWKDMDADNHAKLYTQNIIRITESMKKIKRGENYLSDLNRMMTMMGKKGVSSAITFKFSSRIQSENLAWDRGVYQAIMTHPERGEKIQYAEFSVLLEKIDGQWKIKMDSDRPATKQAFDNL